MAARTETRSPLFAIYTSTPIRLMRIAISLEGEELDDSIDMEFGEAPHFMIVDVIGDKIKKSKVIEIVKSYEKGNEAVSTAKQLEGEGINGVISNAFDPDSFKELSKRGIKVFLAEPGNVMYNIELVVQGDLEPVKTMEDIGYEDAEPVQSEELPVSEDEPEYDEDDDADMPAKDQDEETEKRYLNNEDED
jgi:predicted Fe-Mo cluster-binding NifX family protein